MAVLSLEPAGVEGWFCDLCLFAVGTANQQALLQFIYVHLSLEHGETIRARIDTELGNMRPLQHWVLT